MIYKIDSIRTKDGEPHERESRRKGHRVEIIGMTIGAPLIAWYIDTNYQYLRTSPIVYFNGDWSTSERLTVRTKNTVYEFVKES